MQNVAETIFTAKKVWKADVESNEISFEPNDSWPIDFICAPGISSGLTLLTINVGKLLIQAYIGEDFKATDLQIQTDGRSMDISTTSTSKPLRKRFELPGILLLSFSNLLTDYSTCGQGFRFCFVSRHYSFHQV